MNYHTDSLAVAVFMGGRSVEHPVSCTSGTGVADALTEVGHEVHRIGITREGAWVLLDKEHSRLVISDGVMPEVTLDSGTPVRLSTDPAGPRLIDAQGRSVGHVDVAFPALHGPWGEDGTIQGLFEMASLPYVGSGVLSSSLCMDKGFTKRILAAHSVNQGPYLAIGAHEEVDLDAVAQQLGFPLFLKPARAGSSLGISRVTSKDGLPDAIAKARAVDDKLVLESGFEGVREVEVGVLERFDGGLDISYPLEVLEKGAEGWFDFDAKYLGSPEPFNLRPDFPEGVAEELQEMARTVFRALDCRHFARIDGFLAQDGSVYLNEINTVPGLTPMSGVPQAFSKLGFAYTEIIDRLVRLAARH
ncbi:D-alanine--D-alanine ligase family protein [Natronoglycomyces albus]|uniref:D-alanine--D-alanine ligase n=1 Tax=Natronoglycomyces albus TaxID=2811108 RepID=A0A895XK28_9ACTN|nr:D-alanine--D-alanine ligase family protein [Natronoglycomyces albus]QSB06111.1 D-alanine--D-alanine ligase [Natronoglycomyces albus]